MRVGVAQINIELFDIEANLSKHLLYIEKAKKLGIELLVFPELSISGYQIQEKILEVSMSVENEIIQEIVKKSAGIRVIFGFPEEDRNALIYNSMISVKDENIEFVYRKNNLPNYGLFVEKIIFTPSKNVKNYMIDKEWQYAVLICADMWDPSLVHKTMLENTNLIISPFNSAITSQSDSNIQNWQLCFDFYSMMYGSYIIGANRVGKEGEFSFFGNSVIMGPYGETLTKAKMNEEDLIYADIDYQEIRRARFQAPNMKNLL